VVFPLLSTASFSMVIASGLLLRIRDAFSLMRSRIALQPISKALPLRSAVALAALGLVFATRVVFVLSSFTLEGSIEKTSAATCTILVLRPWPISTPPVLTPTLPS
jgi:hypothetical protein